VDSVHNRVNRVHDLAHGAPYTRLISGRQPLDLWWRLNLGRTVMVA
jgi:hypothetical protein